MSDKPAAPASAPNRASMKKELPEHFRGYKHVWVLIEIERGIVHPVSFELLGAGRKLADSLGVELACAILGRPEERRDRRLRKPSPMAPTSPISSRTRSSRTIATSLTRRR